MSPQVPAASYTLLRVLLADSHSHKTLHIHAQGKHRSIPAVTFCIYWFTAQKQPFFKKKKERKKRKEKKYD